MDEVTIELLVMAIDLGTRVLVTGDGIWMCMGILIQIFLLNNHIPISNPEGTLTDTILGLPTTPSKDMDTMCLLEMAITNAITVTTVNVASTANIVSLAIGIGSEDVATDTPSHIQMVYLHPNPILTPPNPLLSPTWLKKFPSSKMATTRVTH